MFASACIAWFSFAILSDVIVLKNGNEIQGEVLKEEGDRILVKFPGGTLDLERKQVSEIRRQSHVDYLLDEGEKRLRRGEHEDAISAYLDAAREDAGSVRARNGLLESREKFGFALEDLGRYEDAREAFQKLIDQDPDNDTARKELRVIGGILEGARKEEERGRQEIQAGSLEQGIWRLQKIFDGFPGRRKDIGPVLSLAIITQGDRLLQKQDWSGAQAHYQRALSTDTECVSRLRAQHTACKVRLIEPLVSSGDFTTIEKLAAEGLDVDPASEPLRYYRGVALEAKGKAREAAEEYIAILDIKRPSNLEKAVTDLRLRTETKLIEEGKATPTSAPRSREVLPGGFRELRSPHFTIFHRNNTVARDVVFVAERSYASLFRELGCATHLRSPVKVMVFPTKEEYTAASGMQAWSGGAHQVARRMGDLSEHKIYSFQDQPRLMTGILPHEIAHALFAHRLNYPDQIPLWANEGFAVLKEPAFVHAFYRRLLRQEAARKSLWPLGSLCARTEYPADRIECFYGQSFSLVEYLVSLEGTGTFVSFVKSLCESKDGLDAALRRHYHIGNVLALENRWCGWLLDGEKK